MPSFRFRPSPAFAFALALTFTALQSVRAADPVDSRYFQVKGDGTFIVSGIPFGIVVYNASYAVDGQQSVTIDKDYPKTAPGKTGPIWKTKGMWQPKWGGGATRFTQTVERISEKSLRVSYAFEGADGAALNVPHLLAFQFELPAEKHEGKIALVDGSEVPFSTGLSYDNWGPAMMTVPLPEGRLTIRGDLKIRMQDDRPWNSDYFKVWLAIAQAPYSSKTASLDLVFEYNPVP